MFYKFNTMTQYIASCSVESVWLEAEGKRTPQLDKQNKKEKH